MNKKEQTYIPWLVVGLLFIVTALSFLDRQVLSMSIIRIKEDIPISDSDYSWITNGFIVGYALMFTLGGVFIDKFGTKLGLALSLAIWTIASGLHSIATSVSAFVIFRFILGIGEGACFPGVIKSVIEWIPVQKRSLATGIAIGGSAIGAVIAPLMVIYLLDSIGWRSLFLVTPVISFIWIGFWLFFNNKKNSAYKVRGIPLSGSQPEKKYSFKAVLKNKNAWIFIFMRILFDPIFYFLMFWIPKFMNESRDISLELIGKLFWIPFLVLGISNILGGYISDKLFFKTQSIDKARKILMGVAALLTLSVLFVPGIDSAYAVIALISLFFFAHGIWITNYSTAIGDVFGMKATSTMFGLTGTFGAISAFFANRGIAHIVTNYSYDPLWLWAGLMYPFAFVILMVFIPKIKKLDAFA
ncbi:MFS transporter [uncultured Proteiniphilum sp.]|uniref:MFS transporter n=1 Tax=uncultured Proteiniphilum sp. TaxID=497637 RepID=UPI00261A9ABE|nr:MFS transporter [uncultured Proteiniphilum sp.]